MENAVIDWDQLDMIADGFAPDFLEIYYEYLAEIPGLLGNLREKIRAGDALQVSRIAHQIKGSSANFGFIGLSQPAAVLEQEAKAGSLGRAMEHLAAAELGFSRAVAEVKARKAV